MAEGGGKGGGTLGGLRLTQKPYIIKKNFDRFVFFRKVAPQRTVVSSIYHLYVIAIRILVDPLIVVFIDFYEFKIFLFFSFHILTKQKKTLPPKVRLVSFNLPTTKNTL